MAVFEVLVVCTGNLCRSPAAQFLLQRHLEMAAPGAFHVTSAGTGAVVGAAVHPLTVAPLLELGLDVNSHVARQLVADLIAPADLVLTATRRHRAAVAELSPAAVPRVFTLLEFARLAPIAAAQDFTDMPDLVDRARRLRTQLRPQRPGDDDLADPISGGATEHRRSVTVIDEATRAIAGALTARAQRPPITACPDGESRGEPRVR